MGVSSPHLRQVIARYCQAAPAAWYWLHRHRDDKIAGIVSERDLLRVIGRAGPKVLEQPVSDFMTKTVITAREADTVDQLMAEMTTRRFRHMPVAPLAISSRFRSRKSTWRPPQRGSTPLSLGCLSNTRESSTMGQLHEHMPSRHSFITGNMVRLNKRARPRNAAPGPYKVFAQLPERDGQCQYRVKSGYEPLLPDSYGK